MDDEQNDLIKNNGLIISGDENALIIFPRPSPAPLSAALDPLSMLLANRRSENTKRTYEGQIYAFFGFSRADLKRDDDSVDEEAMMRFRAEVTAFLALPVPQIAIRLNLHKAEMLAAKLSESSVNSRLAAIRTLLKSAYRTGHAQTDGRGLVDGEKVRSYRDTRGVGEKMLGKIVDAPDRENVKGLRDAAMLKLTIEQGLRRGELVALNVGDFSLSQHYILILGKGRGTQKTMRSISANVAQAIGSYLLAAGHGRDQGGPLFRNVDRNPGSAGSRLTTKSIYKIVKGYGAKVGAPQLAPHKLRHSVATLALDLRDGDMRSVAKYTRHSNINTLAIYDDQRQDVAGTIASEVTARVNKFSKKK